MKQAVSYLEAKNQRGVSLLTTLVMLTLLMIIGISALRLSKDQLALSGNLQFQTAAFNEAEAAVSVAENLLATTASFKTTGITADAVSDGNYAMKCRTGITVNCRAADPNPLTMDWDNSKAVVVGKQNYFIQQKAKDIKLIDSEAGYSASKGCNQVNLYQVTALGQSNRGASKIVQTVFSVKSCAQT